jgi:hypothetical protein
MRTSLVDQAGTHEEATAGRARLPGPVGGASAVRLCDDGSVSPRRVETMRAASRRSRAAPSPVHGAGGRCGGDAARRPRSPNARARRARPARVARRTSCAVSRVRRFARRSPRAGRTACS